MRRHQLKYVWLSLGAAAAAAVTMAGCSAQSMSSAADGGAGDGPKAPAGRVLIPDRTGWLMGKTSTTRSIQGAWFAYGDHYGGGAAPPGDCDSPLKGNHMPSECSTIDSPAMPPDPATGFANEDGKMCTSGTVAAVINDATGAPDYLNIWGAGMGLDLNSSGGASPVKGTYDAVANGVTGFSFVIDTPPMLSLRVEFPTATASTAPFWQGDNMAASPVVPGLNVIHWADVNGPFYQTSPPPPAMVDATALKSILFHVFTHAEGPLAYSFCVSKLTALTE